MNVHEAIRTKKAVRLFSDQPISDEQIKALIDISRYSQSSKNTQPWQIVVVKDKAKLEALSKTGDYAWHLAGATFALVLVGQSAAGKNSFDLGQLAAYLQLAAWEEGIGSCIASIYHPEQARAILDIPEDMQCDIALSFGYPSPENKTAKMGGRKPIEEFVHWDGWTTS